MKCIIPGTNARVFAKAIQSMAKIGSELFLEADDDGLSIRTVSSTKSAFALIRFHPNFFSDYEVDSGSDDEYANKCKCSMKACTGTFRNMKQVELCKVSIDSANSKLIVQLKCRLETIKTHSISILDFETLQAVYMADSAPNKVTASHKLFSEISNNFQMNEEEITLEAGADNLIVKNYVEGSHVDRRFMRSQLALKSDEFGKYQIDEETSITFCLREFRAILGFAESTNMDMTLNFETAGRPVIFILKNLQTFEVNLVMSTLSPDDITHCENTLPNTTKTDQRKRINENSEINMRAETSSKKIRHSLDTEDSLNGNDDELFNFAPRKHPSLRSVELVRDDSQTNIETPISLPMSIQRETLRSNLINKESEGIAVTFKDTEELDNDNNDNVAKSPNAESRQRTRYVFKRCFEKTFNPKTLPGMSQILAINSDSED